MDYYNNDINFKRALNYIYSVEGGYSNHKNDRGGKTNYGITQKTYDEFRKNRKLLPLSVKDIKKEEADLIYYKNYWCASGANKISDFSMALVLFDSCVNHGVSAGKLLYKKSENDIDNFLKLRKEKYKNIVEKNPSQKIFYNGWINRLKKLKNYIKETEG